MMLLLQRGILTTGDDICHLQCSKYMTKILATGSNIFGIKKLVEIEIIHFRSHSYRRLNVSSVLGKFCSAYSLILGAPVG